jgi:PadR family transcriptional regulator, regulatory protein PadR
MPTEKEPISDNSASQMRKGVLEFCALLIISKGEVYPSDILKELKDHDLLVVEGTLYPLLSRLKDSGLLDYTWVESNAGPPRKYYRLTDAGKEILKAMKKSWANLSSSINSLMNKYE